MERKLYQGGKKIMTGWKENYTMVGKKLQQQPKFEVHFRKSKIIFEIRSSFSKYNLQNKKILKKI